jgi:hypothetical protein
MTITASEVSAQVASDLNDRIRQVWCAVRELDLATGGLVGALEQLDDEDVPEAVRELASDMLDAANVVQCEFEIANLFDNVEALEALAGEAEADDAAGG